MDWFLYDIGLRHERVNAFQTNVAFSFPLKILKKSLAFLMVSGRVKLDYWPELYS